MLWFQGVRQPLELAQVRTLALPRLGQRPLVSRPEFTPGSIQLEAQRCGPKHLVFEEGLQSAWLYVSTAPQRLC